MSVLFLAGIDDSDPQHWQRRWLPRFPKAAWVGHADWSRPVAAAWVADLQAAVEGSGMPLVLVAHSLGCLLATEWLRAHRDARPAGLFLVAPPDPASPAFPHHRISGFRPGYKTRLNCPALVLASRNDPFAGFEYSQRCAAAWKAPLIDAGAHGHLNGASGLEDWVQGWHELRSFIESHGLEDP